MLSSTKPFGPPSQIVKGERSFMLRILTMGKVPMPAGPQVASPPRVSRCALFAVCSPLAEPLLGELKREKSTRGGPSVSLECLEKPHVTFPLRLTTTLPIPIGRYRCVHTCTVPTIYLYLPAVRILYVPITLPYPYP